MQQIGNSQRELDKTLCIVIFPLFEALVDAILAKLNLLNPPVYPKMGK